jgi:hypothetical protein
MESEDVQARGKRQSWTSIIVRRRESLLLYKISRIIGEVNDFTMASTTSEKASQSGRDRGRRHHGSSATGRDVEAMGHQ